MKSQVNTISMLKEHEGLRLTAYPCSVGVWTIGWGHTKGVKQGDTCTMEQAEAWFFDDMVDAISDALFFPFFKDLSHNRQAVIIDMCFNMGLTRVLKFHQTRKYIEQGHFELASIQMLRSKWAKQVGKRAITLSRLMEEG